MTCTATFKKIGLMLLALATLVSVSSATTPVGTVVGAVTVGGTTFSGGSLYYQFKRIAATSGRSNTRFESNEKSTFFFDCGPQ